MNPKETFISPELTVEELTKALYQANLDLDESNRVLRKTQKERCEIFSNLSHDLRSPITAIRSSIEYLQSLQTFSPDEVLSVLSLILRKSIQLEQLINDMFLFASLEASEITFHYESLNLGMFLEEFFYSCELDSNYSTCHLSNHVPVSFPYEVSIDPKLMERVLDNLFTNARKYSSTPASITLNAKPLDNHLVEVEVKDTGIGIAKEYLEKIFDRSYMVSAARTPDNRSGCGLGLSIARSIIEHHGGTIWCESTLGQGSSFFFTLPIIN